MNLQLVSVFICRVINKVHIHTFERKERNVLNNKVRRTVAEEDAPVLGEVTVEGAEAIFFYVHGSVHHKSILINVQGDATICSLYFIILQYHSTCFGCRPHPSSGVHKNVATGTGTSHMIVQLPHWPRWNEVAA